MTGDRQPDSTQPWRGCLALGAVLVGVPYLLFVLNFVAPPGMQEPFASPAYFAWFLGQAVLLATVVLAGFARPPGGSLRRLSGLVLLLFIAMWADDRWRVSIFGPAYHMAPMNPDRDPFIPLVHHWRSPAEAWLLLLALTAVALTWSPARRRWWQTRLALAALAAAVPLAALEVSFRAGWIDVPYTIYRGGSEVFRPNSVLGWSNAEQVVTEQISPDFTVEVRLNARGERGPDVPYERTSGRRRVLVLGDSFTFGAGVGRDQTFAARLAAATGAEVINAGVIGFSTDQEWLYLQQVGLRYQPDEVVLGFYTGNDFGELGLLASYGFSRPYFTLEAGELVPHPVAPDWASDYETDPRPFSFRRVSRAWQFVERTVEALTFRSEHGVQSSPPSAQGGPPPENWLDDALYQGPPPPEAELAAALLTRIRDACDTQGIRFNLLLIPPPELLAGPPPAGDTFRQGKARDYVAARRIGQQLGLRVVDPLRELTARRAAGELMYFPTDSHWTPQAHEVAVEALVEAGVGE